MQSIKSHQYNYYVKNAVIYNFIFTIIAIGFALSYLMFHYDTKALAAVFKNPPPLLFLSLCFLAGTLIGASIWFIMFFIPYITIGRDCISYKVAPLRRRKFIKYEDIASYKISFWFFTLNLTSGKKVRMWLYGVSKKKEMIKRLESVLTQTSKKIT